ncbi:helix-turn-helix domain-containing protein, partial [Hyphomonas pacifica]|uniref:helix-turn-helix domain-containing protein n=1 Tax=Hyphomonas pacifica TaxID=1280941 RepID=UPI001314180E
MAGLDRAERVVLKELVAMGSLRGHSWPSYRTLAAQTGYSVKTVQRAAGSLEKKGLIRRRRKVRGDGSQSVYDFAVTLPIPDLPPGQPWSGAADTMSSLKENQKYKIKPPSCRIRSLEDELLRLFDRAIDWKQTPELLSLHELSVWLLRVRDQEWTSLRKRVLECSIELRDDLQKSGQKLGSWTLLVERLKACRSRQVSEPGSSASNREAPGRINELGIFLGVGANEPRLNMLLSVFRLEQTGGNLVLVTNSPSAADQLWSAPSKVVQS